MKLFLILQYLQCNLFLCLMIKALKNYPKCPLTKSLHNLISVIKMITNFEKIISLIIIISIVKVLVLVLLIKRTIIIVLIMIIWILSSTFSFTKTEKVDCIKHLDFFFFKLSHVITKHSYSIITAHRKSFSSSRRTLVFFSGYIFSLQMILTITKAN